MGTTVETAWGRFRRIVVTPYWCKGSPLAWWDADAGVGISQFALGGHVGHFNLAWWLLGRAEPPLDAKVYMNTNIKWVVLHAPSVRLGMWSLTEMASFMTMHEWNRFVLDAGKFAFRFEGYDLKYSDLTRLALAGQTGKD